MKSSIFLAATGAMLAMASPVNKRALKTKTVWDVVTVTVTAGSEPAKQTEQGVFMESASTSSSAEKVVPKPSIVPYSMPSHGHHGHSHKPYHPPSTTMVVVTTTKAAPPPPPSTTEEPETTSVYAPPPSTTTASSGGDDLGDYAKTMIDHHNMHRSNHSAPAIEWDDELAEWANNIAKGCVFKHDMNQGSGGYGQNLASWGSSGDISGMEVKAGAAGVTDQWYNGEMLAYEGSYGLDNPASTSTEVLHFTQVVWKDTTHAGCATVQCPAGSVLGMDSWYTVCNYRPAGNFGGQYGKNVGRPMGQSTANVQL